MPKSRSRSRGAAKRYQLEPDRKDRTRKSSPRWYAPLVLGVMGLGVVVIVLNYMGIMPFTHHQTQPVMLMIGLAMIGVGFLGTTKIR
jgi:formate-dependent nitrite reductase membrane component NrfD